MLRNNSLLIYLLVLLVGLSCLEATGPDSETDNENNIDEINDDIQEDSTEFIYNFKVRIFEEYLYSNPVNYVWGSEDIEGNKLSIRADFDGRTFKINDYSRSEDFIYGDESEIWEGDSYYDTGIRVTWKSEKDTLQFDYSVEPSELYSGFTSSKTVITNEYGNNFGINATVNRLQIDTAAFVIDLETYTGYANPPVDSKIINSIDSIEMEHPNGEWISFTKDNPCINDLRNGRGSTQGEFYGLVVGESFPLDATLNFRMHNKNGLSYTFQRRIGVIPFSNIYPTQRLSKCADWDTYFNKISISTSELTENYVNATQLPRTVNYFPLPSLNDTLKYNSRVIDQSDNTLDNFEFKLIPLSIETSPDTSIIYERHRFYTDDFDAIQIARIDTVSLSINNKIINSLNFFPGFEVDSKADSIFTHYPADFDIPYTFKGITLSPERGVEKSSACITLYCSSDHRQNWADEILITELILQN